MTLTLHEHPFASYCWKTLIALYEREVSFEPHLVIDMEDRAKLAEIWPMGGIPVLIDDEAGITLPESTVIIEYLDRFGASPRLLPADPDEALRARLWDRIFDADVMTPMQKIVADGLRSAGREDPEGVLQAKATLDQAYELLDGRLAENEWAAGPAFSIADCAAAPSLFYARVVHRWDEPRLANLTRYFEKLTARPSVSRVIEEAREYRTLFPLPWPEYANRP